MTENEEPENGIDMERLVAESVLLNWRHRTVVTVENLKWDNAEHTSLTCDVLFEELVALGPIPFTTMPNADTEHGREVWDNANAGVYGPITEFVPLTPEELRAGMDFVLAREYRLGLRQKGITRAQVDALVEVDEDLQIDWEYGTEFSRLGKLFIFILNGFGKTPEQGDEIWNHMLSLRQPA